MEWTKEADEKLKLLDKYGVSVADMAKVLGTTYSSVSAKCKRLGTTPTTQIPNEGLFSEDRLALPYVREGICLLYIDHNKEMDKEMDIVGYIAKACGFKRSQTEKCLVECHADGTYGRVLRRIEDHCRENYAI